MKSLVAVLTLTTLIAGVATANAEQGSGEAANYALSQKMAAPSAYAASRAPARHLTMRATGYNLHRAGR